MHAPLEALKRALIRKLRQDCYLIHSMPPSCSYSPVLLFIFITVRPLMVTLTGNGAQIAGEGYTLTCTASGGEGTLTYQWHRFGMLLDTQDTPNAFSFSPLRQAHAGPHARVVYLQFQQYLLLSVDHLLPPQKVLSTLSLAWFLDTSR